MSVDTTSQVAEVSTDVENETVQVDLTLLSPYKAAKVANVIITGAGFKAIPPQMVYNYTTGQLNKGKKAMIPCTTVEDGSTKITKSAIEGWAHKYVQKKRDAFTLAIAFAAAAVESVESTDDETVTDESVTEEDETE